LKPNEDSHKYQQEGLRQAQQKAMNSQLSEKEFSKQLQETRMAVEKEIHRQLVEQLVLRSQKKSVTPEQQALIEKLYLDLRLINPELAIATLKASVNLNETNLPSGASSTRLAQPISSNSKIAHGSPRLYHSQGSIVN
jgi:ribosomal protein L17